MPGEETQNFRKAALAALEELKGIMSESREILKELREARNERRADDDDD